MSASSCVVSARISLPSRTSPTRRPLKSRRQNFESLKPTSLRHEQVIHFGQIMIFCRQPKNGYCVYAPLRQIARHTNGRKRFINAIGRSAEQPHLLPGHDCDGAISQAIQIFSGEFVAAKTSILFSQYLDNGVANRSVDANFALRRRRFLANSARVCKNWKRWKNRKEMWNTREWFRAIRPPRYNYSPSGIPSLCLRNFTRELWCKAH